VAIKLAIFSGLRQGEQFALRLGDLDFHAGQVRVRRTLSWDWKRQQKGESRSRFTSPKSKAGTRNVDLAPDLLEDLRRYADKRKAQERARLTAHLEGAERRPLDEVERHVADCLLFATSAGTPLDPRNVVDRVFKRALRRAEMRHLRWHDLRHTYASLQLAAGANIKYLSQQMGHASVQITLDRYSHLLQDSHPAQAAKLSAFVFASPPAVRGEAPAPGANEEPKTNQKNAKGSAFANLALTEDPLTAQKAVKDGVMSGLQNAA